MKKIFWLGVMVFAVFMSEGCKKEEEPLLAIKAEEKLVGATTAEVHITFSCVRAVTSSRIYVSTTAGMTVSAWYEGEMKGNNVTYEISDLEKETKYYYYYWFSDGLAELVTSDNIRTFETGALRGVNNGHSWVNLGTNVNWATMNVGAAKEEDYGNYYAWGETNTKKYYTWSSYKYMDNNGWLTKYGNKSYQGIEDGRTVLETTDDAACVNWGGKWRMPTYAEWGALMNKCRWEWTTEEGVNGYRVKGKTGESIFLPASGYRDDFEYTDVNGENNYGAYWSSTLDAYPLGACYLSFDLNNYKWRYYSRHYGQSVRPVCDR